MREAVKTLSLWLFAIFSLGAALGVVLNLLGVTIFPYGALAGPRNGFTAAFFLLLVALVWPGSAKVRLGLFVLTPFLTQYYQTVLSWDVPQGATSIARILPFIAMAAVCIPRAWTAVRDFTKGEVLGSVAVLGLSVVGFFASFDRAIVGATGVFLLGILGPAAYAYIKKELADRPEAKAILNAALFLAFIILCLGTLVVIQVGMGIGIGAETGGGILATRNISDFNLIISYLLLLWPFAAHGARAYGPVGLALVSALFLLTSIVGLSRVAMTIGPVLILFTYLSILRESPKFVGKTVLIGAVCFGLVWMAIPGRDDLVRAWTLRFNVTSLDQVFTILERVRPGGEDSFARDQLRTEAQHLFQRDPILGHGLGGFSVTSTSGYGDAHSLSLNLLAEHGVPGLVAFAAACGLILLRGLKLCTARLARWPTPAIFVFSFLAWLAAVHTVGGNLLVLLPRSFVVNFINLFLLALYLHPERILEQEPT